jgi:hypothetical protein
MIKSKTQAITALVQIIAAIGILVTLWQSNKNAETPTGEHRLAEQAYYAGYAYEIDNLSEMLKHDDQSAIQELLNNGDIAVSDTEKKIFVVGQDLPGNCVQFRFAGRSEDYWTLKTAIINKPKAEDIPIK